VLRTIPFCRIAARRNGPPDEPSSSQRTSPGQTRQAAKNCSARNLVRAANRAPQGLAGGSRDGERKYTHLLTLPAYTLSVNDSTKIWRVRPLFLTLSVTVPVILFASLDSHFGFWKHQPAASALMAMSLPLTRGWFERTEASPFPLEAAPLEGGVLWEADPLTLRVCMVMATLYGKWRRCKVSSATQLSIGSTLTTFWRATSCRKNASGCWACTTRPLRSARGEFDSSTWR